MSHESSIALSTPYLHCLKAVITAKKLASSKPPSKPMTEQSANKHHFALTLFSLLCPSPSSSSSASVGISNELKSKGNASSKNENNLSVTFWANSDGGPDLKSEVGEERGVREMEGIKVVLDCAEVDARVEPETASG